MLVSLHVKNLALIDETEVEFGEGLNILTGETGSGKSIIIGSINLALGGKASPDLIRRGAEYAFIEMVFQVDKEQVLRRLKDMDLPLEEDGLFVVQRKIMSGRSTCKINGETISAKQLKEVAALLLDMHGQREHQTLLDNGRQLEIVDAFAGKKLSSWKESLKEVYREYRETKEVLEEASMDEAARLRELSLAEFEVQEITEAHLIEGEEEELENRFRKMVNSKRIMEALSIAGSCLFADTMEGASSQLGRAIREVNGVMEYDTELSDLSEQLVSIEGLLSDVNRSISSYMEDAEFDQRSFAEVENRLTLLHNLQSKYGNTYAQIQEYLKKRQAEVERYQNLEAFRIQAESKLAEQLKKMNELCTNITLMREKEAENLSKKMKRALEDLNFQDVQFQILVEAKETVGIDGRDRIVFMISTNAGEPVKPLSQVASGGELSRIMLALKTVLADADDIDTLIFDEIDTGISGKTAWKVSEKMAGLGESRQVIAITHLPQIAVMADTHFMIEKKVLNHVTKTSIQPLQEKGRLEEIARMLGGDTITESAIANAKELKEKALAVKELLKKNQINA